MNITPLAGQKLAVEHFRNLLFHIQLDGGSFNEMLAFIKSSHSIQNYQMLREQEPSLVRQMIAREHVLEAKKASSQPKIALDFLHKSLELDPYCPEACLEMGNLSDTAEKAMMWYQRAMKNTEKALGKDRLNHLLSEFRNTPWKQVELYTYLKAKACLAERLFLSGHFDIAILHFKEILEWNPGDDLQVRQMLLVAYLNQNQLKDAAYLIRDFKGDWSASWYYSKAFHRYKLMGDNTASRRWLIRAFQRNLWVPVYLFGLMEIKSNENSKNNLRQEMVYKIGSKAEALDCIRKIAPLFYNDQGMVDWTWNILKASV